MSTTRETYEALIAEAMPYARAEVAAMKDRGDNLSNEPSWLRNIAASYASTAMIRGETIAQVAARLCPANIRAAVESSPLVMDHRFHAALARSAAHDAALAA
jgi:hypothetical protein